MVLESHQPPCNVGFPPANLVLFNLEAIQSPVVVEGLTMAMYESPGFQFSVEVLVRDGTALGGTQNSGPGSSRDGWTSLGVVQGVQGPVFGGISLPIAIPRFVVRPGHLTGVALNVLDGTINV